MQKGSKKAKKDKKRQVIFCRVYFLLPHQCWVSFSRIFMTVLSLFWDQNLLASSFKWCLTCPIWSSGCGDIEVFVFLGSLREIGRCEASKACLPSSFLSSITIYYLYPACHWLPWSALCLFLNSSPPPPTPLLVLGKFLMHFYDGSFTFLGPTSSFIMVSYLSNLVWWLWRYWDFCVFGQFERDWQMWGI